MDFELDPESRGFRSILRKVRKLSDWMVEIADVLGLTLAPAAPPVIAQWMTLGAKDAAMLRAQGVMRLTLPRSRAEALIRRWASKS
jgi:hypothetical protein